MSPVNVRNWSNLAEVEILAATLSRTTKQAQRIHRLTFPKPALVLRSDFYRITSVKEEENYKIGVQELGFKHEFISVFANGMRVDF